jgi:hypothetical protein
MLTNTGPYPACNACPFPAVTATRFQRRAAPASPPFEPPPRASTRTHGTFDQHRGTLRSRTEFGRSSHRRHYIEAGRCPAKIAHTANSESRRPGSSQRPKRTFLRQLVYDSILGWQRPLGALLEGLTVLHCTARSFGSIVWVSSLSQRAFDLFGGHRKVSAYGAVMPTGSNELMIFGCKFSHRLSYRRTDHTRGPIYRSSVSPLLRLLFLIPLPE